MDCSASRSSIILTGCPRFLRELGGHDGPAVGPELAAEPAPDVVLLDADVPGRDAEGAAIRAAIPDTFWVETCTTSHPASHSQTAPWASRQQW